MTRFMFISMIALLPLSGAAADRGRTPEALSQLEQGRWLLKALDGRNARTICLGDPNVLLQLRHGGLACKHNLVSSTADEVVVAYSCPGRGNGRTSVRVETPRLAQIQSQGIADGQPFDIAFEARQAGACPARKATTPAPVTNR